MNRQFLVDTILSDYLNIYGIPMSSEEEDKLDGLDDMELIEIYNMQKYDLIK
jgi:hypothetical protein